MVYKGLSKLSESWPTWDSGIMRWFCLAVCTPVLVLAVETAWYGGGVADGYDQARAGGAPDYPQVNSVTGPVSITTHSGTNHLDVGFRAVRTAQ